MKDEIKEKIYELRAYLGTEENWLLNDIAYYITNLQEELKSANESITWWTNRFKAVEKENQRLKDEKPEYILRWKLEEQLEDYKKEIERLNNIIDELEKYLKENSKDLQFECSRYYKDVLDKLKELKDKNE